MTSPSLLLQEAFQKRSSIHNITDDISISDSHILELVHAAVLHSPTPFNCQSGRVVVLLKAEHHKFWDMAFDVAKASVAPPVFEKAFRPRVEMFRRGYGSILFYESTNAMRAAQEKMPIVKDKMPQWTEHASGMLQYAVWTLLCAEGLGVSLQHYNPMIDEVTAKQWNITDDWSLKAQMVFGEPAGPRFAVKEFEPVEGRVKAYGMEELDE